MSSYLLLLHKCGITFDEQTLGNHDYCFSNLKCTGYLNDPITLEEITEEALKLKTDKAAGPDGIVNTSIKLGFQQMQRYVFHLTSALRSRMHPEFGSYHILNHFRKAKGAKQNQVPTGALACYDACTSYSRVSFTSVCERIERNQILPPSQ